MEAETKQPEGRWRSRENRARNYCDPSVGMVYEIMCGFRECDPMAEAVHVFKAHAEPQIRRNEYQPAELNLVRRFSQSFTNRLKAVDWNYYLGQD
jgi:hypothetical protein